MIAPLDGTFALLRIGGGLLLVLAFAGCGSSSHGGTTASNSPVLANLNVATSAQNCTVSNLPGHVRTVSVSFVDPDGNETGGHIDLNLTAPGIQLTNLTAGVPSNGVTLSGTTSGTITVSPLCIAVIGGTATLNATLTDAAGNVSNTVSTTVSGLRPTSGEALSGQTRAAGAIGVAGE